MVTLVAVASCVVFEFLIQKFIVKGPCTICNYSAILTGVLLGFNLPSILPLWIVVVGAFIAIAVAKMTFGGLGKNPFNPALVGRVFLLIAYPAQMTTFGLGKNMVDTFSGATPLAALKPGVGSFTIADVNFQDMMFGSIAGSLGEVASLMLILGGLYLLWRKVITWHAPVAILGTMAVFAAIFAFASGYSAVDALRLSLFHVVAGGALLGAIFMATDYVTSPMTHKGMIIYGVGIGLLTMFIRLWGAYPEGMSFAILIMNSVVPLINKYVKPKRFGLIK